MPIARRRSTALVLGSLILAAPLVAVAAPASAADTDIRINEVESRGGTPGDWVELGNTGISTVDVSGFVIRDEDDTEALILPEGTTIESGGYLAVDTEAEFGLGGGDSARVFAADGTTLLDSYTWTAHATTTYGRCPDLTGDFTTTTEPTKGLINSCDGDGEPTPSTPWPGSPDVTTVDLENTFSEDLSGLAYETAAAGDILWAVQNGDGLLYRLVFDGTNWVPDAGEWTDGTTLRYPDGTGVVDAEGVGLTGAGSSGGVYVSSERNNDADDVSRPSILRYDVGSVDDEISATQEWDLTADLPGLGANGGLEGISWIPDTDLVASGFLDEATGAAYDPTDYPGHGDGLFFVGVETDGNVYGYALDADGGYVRVATIESGFEIVAELEYDAASGQLLVVCDDICAGRISPFAIGDSGTFEPVDTYERPASMPNIANEGFALAPACIDGARAAFWADDADTDGFSVRAGTFDCVAAVAPGVPAVPGGSGAGDELAATGTDDAALLLLAVALLGGGAVLLAARRRVSQA